ncbi:unnamed protein product, partial [Mesorhabditis belari]|uniref:SXP/RAL-2 family protein Ani s 5-like cation-binding domain-containing protein n=1 Tax=Mesorhabditis belari TaxID=2138241 RepID=A0AAF3FGZ4_9BILA
MIFLFGLLQLTTAQWGLQGPYSAQLTGYNQQQQQQQQPIYQNTFPIGPQVYSMGQMPTQMMTQYYPQQSQIGAFDGSFLQRPFDSSNARNSEIYPSSIQGISSFSEGTVYSNDQRLPSAFSQDTRMQFKTPLSTNSIQSIAAQPAQPAQPQRIVPPFLKGVDKETEDRFYQIVQNLEWNGEEKAKKIEDFIKELDAKRQETFTDFKQKIETETMKRQKEVHQVVNGMSEEAKIQFQKVSALLTQPNLSDETRLEKISQFYAKIPIEIRKEFDQKLAQFGRR